jgi:excisionase family DNA binding protein
MEKLMNLQTVAQTLDVSDKLVRRLIREGRIKFIRVGREYRFKREWVDAYLERGTDGVQAVSGKTQRRAG